MPFLESEHLDFRQFKHISMKTTAVSGVEGRLGMSRPGNLLQRGCLSGHYSPGAMVSDSLRCA